MADDVYSIRHEEQRAGNDADQVEARALLTGAAVIDVGIFDQRLAEALEPEEFEPGLAGMADEEPGFERWHEQDLGVEGSVSAISDEIIRRAGVLEAAYPFELTRNTLRYVGKGTGIYEYCLGICLAPNVTTGEYVRLPRSFERIVAILLKLYLGANAESLHTGAPRDPEVGKNWRAAMATLEAQSGEWHWSPEEGFPEEPTVGGDAGMDFVVWKGAPDARPGHLYIVGQCACGGDWASKLDELNLEVLGSWFRPISKLAPVRAFATPFMLSEGNFLVAHKRAGWVLDRGRIVGMATAAAGHPELTQWEAEVRALTQLGLAA